MTFLSMTFLSMTFLSLSFLSRVSRARKIGSPNPRIHEKDVIHEKQTPILADRRVPNNIFPAVPNHFHGWVIPRSPALLCAWWIVHSFFPADPSLCYLPRTNMSNMKSQVR